MTYIATYCINLQSINRFSACRSRESGVDRVTVYWSDKMLFLANFVLICRSCKTLFGPPVWSTAMRLSCRCAALVAAVAMCLATATASPVLPFVSTKSFFCIHGSWSACDLSVFVRCVCTTYPYVPAELWFLRLPWHSNGVSGSCLSRCCSSLRKYHRSRPLLQRRHLAQCHCPLSI